MWKLAIRQFFIHTPEICHLRIRYVKITLSNYAHINNKCGVLQTEFLRSKYVKVTIATLPMGHLGRVLYPQKGSAKAHPMGSSWFSYELLSFVTSELKLEFQFWDGNSPKKIEKKPLLYGWTDGWTGGRTDGDQKCPLKIFILCVYIDKVYTYLYIS